MSTTSRERAEHAGSSGGIVTLWDGHLRSGLRSVKRQTHGLRLESNFKDSWAIVGGEFWFCRSQYEVFGEYLSSGVLAGGHWPGWTAHTDFFDRGSRSGRKGGPISHVMSAC